MMKDLQRVLKEREDVQAEFRETCGVAAKHVNIKMIIR